MRRVFVAVIAALAMLVTFAPPAQATFLGTSCGKWSHATGAAQGCVTSNRHDLTDQIQGLARFRISDSPDGLGFTYAVEFDYVRLLKNGNVVAANNADAMIGLHGGWTERATGWNAGQAGTYKTTARYRFWHMYGTQFDGHNSGWVVRTSAPFTV